MPGLFHGTSLERPVTCERCEKPLEQCRCPRTAGVDGKPGAVRPPKDQPARVRRERRRGKWVTVVTGLDPHATDLSAMLKAFRTSLGTGGTVADGELELQGDHRETVLARLIEMGYPAKSAGG